MSDDEDIGDGRPGDHEVASYTSFKLEGDRLIQLRSSYENILQNYNQSSSTDRSSLIQTVRILYDNSSRMFSSSENNELLSIITSLDQRNATLVNNITWC